MNESGGVRARRRHRCVRGRVAGSYFAPHSARETRDSSSISPLRFSGRRRAPHALNCDRVWRRASTKSGGLAKATKASPPTTSPPRRRPSTRSINRDFRCPSRWLTPFSIPRVVIVVAWATLLFFGFGLPSGGNVMSYVVLAVGALAVTSAAYLILDLSGPYSGLF